MSSYLHAFSSSHLTAQRRWVLAELKQSMIPDHVRDSLRDELANIRAELRRRVVQVGVDK